MTLETLVQQAFAPARQAIDEGRIPGAVLGVLTAGGERAVAFAGWAQRVPTLEPLRRDHWFDLASLTKVIFTTTEILRRVDAGQIRLDDTLASVIPDLRQYDPDAPERQLTFRQCLTHQTHLPAVQPIYTYGLDPRTTRAFILQREWRHGAPVYSDVNFMLLGIALERLAGKPLSAFETPGGLTFHPHPAQCAATEHDTWRGRLLRGEVHDENAFALGGAAGHAGLFGTVDGVLDFARSVLEGTAFSETATEEVRRRHGPVRTVGWEARYEGWPGGMACSPETIGHTGFTGTGLWLDFARGLAWTLLTNRVHPSRHAESRIQPLRRATSDAVFAAFDGGRGVTS